jgi:hypothetical protein
VSKAGSGLKTVTGFSKMATSRLSNSRPDLMSEKALETILGHYPAGASLNSGKHFMQNM